MGIFAREFRCFEHLLYLLTTHSTSTVMGLGLGLKSERVVERGYSFQGVGVGSKPYVSLKKSINSMLPRMHAGLANEMSESGLCFC